MDAPVTPVTSGKPRSRICVQNFVAVEGLKAGTYKTQLSTTVTVVLVSILKSQYRNERCKENGEQEVTQLQCKSALLRLIEYKDSKRTHSSTSLANTATRSGPAYRSLAATEF